MLPSTMPPAVLLDPWDTPFFGRRIARVDGAGCEAGNMPVLLRWYVCNAPSPAATAALEIGKSIADQVT